ncbi:MAG: hypothetical protein K2J20_01280 [Bacilli bacterium]|nr:hypothetical protein [Bacilli bacterium]
MIRNVISFLDRHRVALVLIILFLISIIFLGVKSYLFLHHEFQNLECTSETFGYYCEHDDIQILANPIDDTKTFFEENKEEIKALNDKYSLPEFNFYTAYFYQIASEADYKIHDGSRDIYTFLESYCNTYDLKNYYIKNNFYFDIFYYFRININ